MVAKGPWNGHSVSLLKGSWLSLAQFWESNRVQDKVLFAEIGFKCLCVVPLTVRYRFRPAEQ